MKTQIRHFRSRASMSLVEFVVAVGLIFVLVGLLIPCVGTPNGRTRARRIQCMNNLRQIGLAMHQYATDHDGRFPESRSGDAADPFRLLSNYIGNAGAVFKCPSDAGKTWTNVVTGLSENNLSYAYARGFGTESAINMPVAFDRGVDLDPPDGRPLADFGGKRWKLQSPHKDDGGNVLFAALHISFNTRFPNDPIETNSGPHLVEMP